MNYLLIGLAFVTFFSTLLGGLFALRYKKSLCYFFAFSAGTLIAVSFFDLLPESISLANATGLQVKYLSLMIVGSFLFYVFLEKLFLTHHHHENEGHGHIMGPIGAGSLVLHSLLDGAAIGAAFHVNSSVGLIVALAVISHDFTDGINTVTLMLKNKHKDKRAIMFLVADAIAPVLGVIIASVFVINSMALALILAFFIGEFIYLGASNLLPELREEKSLKILLWMLIGAALIFVLTWVI